MKMKMVIKININYSNIDKKIWSLNPFSANPEKWSNTFKQIVETPSKRKTSEIFVAFDFFLCKV